MTDRRKFKVTLLGTGTPIPSATRFGPCTLVEVGGRKLLIDAGRGATVRLAQLGIPIGAVDALLLTHFHSDHTVGIPDIWLTGLLASYFGRRQAPLHVIGPCGTRNLISNLEQAYAADIRIRVEDENLRRDVVAIQVKEFDQDGVIYQTDAASITAFEVDHGDAIKPAYGYRIESDGHVAVISGDTRPNENLIKNAAGADLLVHEVAIARPELMAEPHIGRIMAHHTSPREAGVVFSRTRPKLAAYTHLVFLASHAVPPASVADLIAETRHTYGGPLEVGEDLLCFEIADRVLVGRRPV